MSDFFKLTPDEQWAQWQKWLSSPEFKALKEAKITESNRILAEKAVYYQFKKA